MKVLVSWLRELVDVRAGAEELGQRLHLAGFELAGIEPHGADAVVDLEITANRPDCLSMVGLAREVSTLYDTPLRWKPSSFPEPGQAASLELQPPRRRPAHTGSAEQRRGSEAAVAPPEGRGDQFNVTIEDAALCPRYCAAVADVTVGPSPAWLVERLAAAGIRSINNIVDVTNYVLLETGQPLHAFDLAKLAGPHLRVRRAEPGETVKTLDGQTRTLAPEMLVIADAERAQAVAGVMGGAESEVSEATATIALESAYFQAASVRRTSKRLALSTEASYRFERGADPEAASSALARACELIAQIGAGTVRPGWIDARPAPRAARTLALRHGRVRRVLGFDVEAAEVERILRALGFGLGDAAEAPEGEDPQFARIEEMQALFDSFGGDGSANPSIFPDLAIASVSTAPAGPDAPTWPQVERRRPGRDRRRAAPPETVWRVTTPSWRIDVAREIDLIEEVARIHGYDRIPTTFPALTTAPPPANVRLRRDAQVRAIARALGFAESVTFSFIEREIALRYANAEALVSIANPLSETFAVMRPALLPGLVASVAHNRRREQRDVRLFELANRFTQSRGEHRALALAWTGAASPTHWSGTARAADIFDLTGAVTALGHAIGLEVRFAPAAARFLTESTASEVLARRSPGLKARGHDDGAEISIGSLGQLEAAAADAAGLPAREAVLVAEIDLDAVLAVTDLGDTVRATPLPRFPSSVRDLSLLMPLGLPAADIRGTIRESAPATLESVFEFDRYQGRGVPDGACSISVRLTFRSPERTLTDAEVQSAVDALVAALTARHNATLR